MYVNERHIKAMLLQVVSIKEGLEAILAGKLPADQYGTPEESTKIERRILAALKRSSDYLPMYPNYRTYLIRNGMTRSILRRALGHHAEGFDAAIQSLMAQGKIEQKRKQNPDNNNRVCTVWFLIENIEEHQKNQEHYARSEQLSDDERHKEMMDKALGRTG